MNNEKTFTFLYTKQNNTSHKVYSPPTRCLQRGVRQKRSSLSTIHFPHINHINRTCIQYYRLKVIHDNIIIGTFGDVMGTIFNVINQFETG